MQTGILCFVYSCPKHTFLNFFDMHMHVEILDAPHVAATCVRTSERH